jgi:8-oxo-dGTP diphosphatase
MTEVFFCDDVDKALLKYAVIAARYEDKWIFCRHKDRSSYELPGGHREAGEAVENTAARELFEETGAIDFNLMRVGVYGVTRDGETSYGMLYYADVVNRIAIPSHSEIAETVLTDRMPQPYTYPDIQPSLATRIENASGIPML